MPAQRTYWHLQGERRVPSSYEILSSRLLYYRGRGFEVRTPVARWLEKFQSASPLEAAFADFSDPRETTYASYVALQQEQELFVTGLFESAEEAGHDRTLGRDWLSTLERVLPVLRYPAHGLQMLASYVGSMAPEGRIVIAAAFQAGDEMRRVQRLSYRMAQLSTQRANFGSGARASWQEDAAWQPLRAVLERLLARYDFGEAFVGLSLVLGPAFDELFMVQFAELARERGDTLSAELFRCLDKDCRWHREWTHAALHCAIGERGENLEPIARWVSTWWAPTEEALASLVTAWGVTPNAAERYLAQVKRACRAGWSRLGVP